MAGAKVFVTRLMNRDALDLIAAETDMQVWPDDHPPAPEVLREKLSGADGLLTTVMDRVDASLLDSAPQLRVVSQLGVGVDNLDVAAATERAIPVGNTPGVLATATADLAFALLMSVARRVVETDRWVRAGGWELAFHPDYWIGADVGGATIGIVGMGKIGIEMAKRASGFDMKVLYYSRTRAPSEEERFGMEYTNLPTLLGNSDFVTLHVPLTSQTRHLIGDGELATMKRTAMLVNTSRGPVVDPVALHRALVEGSIAGAALDVTEPEPLPPDDPLLKIDNLVVTPHIGSAAASSRRSMCMLAARNLLAGVKWERLEQCVNPEVYDYR